MCIYSGWTSSLSALILLNCLSYDNLSSPTLKCNWFHVRTCLYCQHYWLLRDDKGRVSTLLPCACLNVGVWCETTAYEPAECLETWRTSFSWSVLARVNGSRVRLIALPQARHHARRQSSSYCDCYRLTNNCKSVLIAFMSVQFSIKL